MSGEELEWLGAERARLSAEVSRLSAEVSRLSAEVSRLSASQVMDTGHKFVHYVDSADESEPDLSALDAELTRDARERLEVAPDQWAERWNFRWLAEHARQLERERNELREQLAVARERAETESREALTQRGRAFRAERERDELREQLAETARFRARLTSPTGEQFGGGE